MVDSELDLVYGGGDVGLMGHLSKSVMSNGGKVYGVIPRGLFAKEVASRHITKLFSVSSMHERKAKMEKLSDAFLAIPGGFGTLDELFEIITWNQIGLHTKPVFLLNEFGFYDSLIQQMKKMVKEGFISPAHYSQLRIAKNLQELKKQLLKNRLQRL